MLDNRKMLIAGSITLPLIIILIIIISTVATNKSSPKIFNVIDNCSQPIICDEGTPLILGQFIDERISVKVVGTIYRNVGNYTIYASCFDSSGHGLDSNASAKIYDKDNASYINWTNMTQFSIGNHKLIGLVPSTEGNYFIIVNCTSGSNWGIGFNEFQVPDWLNILLNTTNQTEQYAVDILNNTQTIINITNTTQDWVGKLLEYWGIKIYTCLNIYNDVPTTANRGEEWEIKTQVTDEYNTTQTGSDVSCNISTSFWGESTMTYSVITERFIYYNYLNSSGTLTYDVTCEEIGKSSQSLC